MESRVFRQGQIPGIGTPGTEEEAGNLKARSLTIELSHLPRPELSSNARIHWTVRKRVFAEEKAEIGWLAKEEWRNQLVMERARISYEYHCPDRRARDFDNLITACKPYPDGLKDVGVIRADDTLHLQLGSAKCVYDGTRRTVIIVEEV